MSADDKEVWGDAALLAFCGVIALGGLAIAAWVVGAGNLLTLDGILLVLISLVFVAVFGGMVAWSIRNGDVQAILRRFGKHEIASSL